jgi:hypothetical protein
MSLTPPRVLVLLVVCQEVEQLSLLNSCPLNFQDGAIFSPHIHSLVDGFIS